METDEEKAGTHVLYTVTDDRKEVFTGNVWRKLKGQGELWMRSWVTGLERESDDGRYQVDLCQQEEEGSCEEN